MRTASAVGVVSVVLVVGAAASRSSVGGQAIHELRFTETEEQRLGADVSAKLRERFGVAQDPAVHKYVSLVGSSLAMDSNLATLRWTFIVLDTDGVNAFAAPGGYVHITKGALALIRNEAELAGVLGHEIGHVMARHTIKAVQNTKVEGALAEAATRGRFLEQVGNRLYTITLENAFDRGDEMEADYVAAPLANDSGYNPGGLSAFLTALTERHKALATRSGLFASHAEVQARVAEFGRRIRNQGLKNTALVQARYAASITYRPVAVAQLGQGEPAPAPGVNPDRDARGGPDKALVVVTVTAEEVQEFRRGIAG